MAGKILRAACSGATCILRRRLPPEGAPGQPREALSLIGDGDELDLTADVERSFAIKFGIAELEHCLTAGDLRDAVWRHMQSRQSPGNLRCMTAMAFHALRRVLMAGGAARTIRLTDRLDSFAQKPRDLARALRRQTSLSVDFRGGPLGLAGGYMQLAWLPLIGGLVTAHFGVTLASAAVAACGMLAMRLDPWSFGNDTVADLTRRAAAKNFGLLAARGGRFDEHSVWQTLRHVLADHSDCRPDEIGLDTHLIQQR
jgi:hypothetical protein